MTSTAVTNTDLIVNKTDLGATELVPNRCSSDGLADGEVLLVVDRFALTSNNLSYASAGDRLGYWNFFPADRDGWGRVPVWGYATVEASRCAAVTEGEEIFGFLPMASHVVLTPDEVTEVSFNDITEHRRSLHPWYNRYYRTAGDPVSATGHHAIQPVLWPLFMTGWVLAVEFTHRNNFGAEVVVVGSASSKTAYSFAFSMVDRCSTAEIIGLTSQANASFLVDLEVYDSIILYDDLDRLPTDRRAAFVDMSGNAEVIDAVYRGFGDNLVESVRVGATHLGKRGSGETPPGPTPRFFFIPDEAERAANEQEPSNPFHQWFARSWDDFATWIEPRITLTEATGPAAIQAAYLAAFGGRHEPSGGTILRYR